MNPEKLRELGVAGEINFHLYNKEGQFLISKSNLTQKHTKYLEQYYSQVFAFGVEDLKIVTKNPGVDLISVAGGVEKRDSILGAIRTGLVRTLITDGDNARWLIRA